MTDIPRRCRIDLYVPAETAIREAMLAVEAMAADVRLTKAVTLLSEAKDAVADYVDNRCPACGSEPTHQTPTGQYWDGNAHFWWKR